MISAIVVTYNSGRYLSACLESLEGSGVEVVVVDNGSTDGTVEQVRSGFPWVKLVASPKNLGFAAAANWGVRHTAGNALLFLNPDTVCRGPIQALEEALEEGERVAAVAPCLVNGGGKPQIGFTVRRLPTLASLLFEILLLNRLFPRNPVNRRYRCLDLDLSKPAEVEQPAGACLLVRRSSFERLGGFDEAFFPLWFEDVDLCRRLRQQGGTILFRPQVLVQHRGGHSLESLTFSEKQIYWYRNLLYYVRKSFPWGASLAVRGAVLCGLGLRFVMEWLESLGHPQSQEPLLGEKVRAYWSAAKLSIFDWR